MAKVNIALCFVATIFFVAGCDKKAAKEKPVPEVFVITAEEKAYKPSRGYSARIQSRSDVDIRAQVSGELIKIHFREGDQVAKDAPLFDIDPAPYKAALAREKAGLAKSQASKRNDERNFQRGKKLVKDGFISESEFDTLEARMLESAAQVEAGLAAVDSAQVDLAYTKILAPQDGRVGRSIPAIGDVVNPGYGTLTTVVGQNDMDVVFQVPERVLLAARRPDSKIKVTDIVVAVGLADNTEYSYTGKIDYFSNRVDPTTGTIETRARIPNPNDLLRPGMFVRAILRLDHPLQGLMVPQASVQVDQRGTYVLVVDENNMVARKNLVTSERIGENVLVNSGLNVGDRVVMRGVQKARPGDVVVVSEFKPATDADEGVASDQ